MVPLWCLAFSGLLLGLGLAIVLAKRNAVIGWAGLQLMFAAALLNVAMFCRYGRVTGDIPVFALVAVLICLAEAAVLLAFALGYYRQEADAVQEGIAER